MKTVKELREITGLSQPKFCAKYYNIPKRTLQQWEYTDTCPHYLNALLEAAVLRDYGMQYDHLLIETLQQLSPEQIHHIFVSGIFTDVAARYLSTTLEKCGINEIQREVIVNLYQEYMNSYAPTDKK